MHDASSRDTWQTTRLIALFPIPLAVLPFFSYAFTCPSLFLLSSSSSISRFLSDKNRFFSSVLLARDNYKHIDLSLSSSLYVYKCVTAVSEFLNKTNDFFVETLINVRAKEKKEMRYPVYLPVLP